MSRYFCKSTVRRNELKKLKILIFTTNQALTLIYRNEKRNPKIVGALARHVLPAPSFPSRKSAITYLNVFSYF